jgi:hypothetical protein
VLDPLTALSLASSIVQIVDFSIELVTDGVELYNKGSLSNYNELEQATLHLTELTKALSSPVQFNITQPGIVPKPLSQNEARLQGLAKSCRELGEQLLAMLDEVKTQEPRNWLESFRKAIRASKDKDKIHDFEKRLKRLQDQLNSHLLAILRLTPSAHII